MNIHVLPADLADPAHQAAVLDLIDGYARDPMGGGRPLPDPVRSNLISGLKAHPTTLVFLAFARIFRIVEVTELVSTFTRRIPGLR